MSGLQQVYQRRLAGTAQTEVIAENAGGHQVAVLKQWDGTAGTPVRTTIEAGVQRPRTSAVAGQSVRRGHRRGPGVQRAYAGRRRPGRRRDPGWIRWPASTSRVSAFTIVSTAALLASGTAVAGRADSLPGQHQRRRPDVQQRARPCSALGGRRLFSSDFEQSCGTAFTTLSPGLAGSRLATSAAKLRARAWSGGCRSARSRARSAPRQTQGGLAANTVGEQGVEVSPLDMALVAAGVDAGKWRPPVLVTSPPDPGPGPAGGGRRADGGRAAHADAGGGGLRRRPGRQPGRRGGVYGQVGTAQVTRASKWWAHWFVGYRGDVAFAVLELTKSPSSSAVSLGASFLSGLG